MTREVNSCAGSSSWRWRAFIAAASVLLATGCGGADDPIAWGHYTGEQVVFSVEGIHSVKDITLRGMECRVPFPEFEQLSLCKHSAPGFLVGPFAVADGEFRASTDELNLTGRFDEEGRRVSGTWSFRRECVDGSICSASGEWHSSFDEALPPPPDVVEADVHTSPDSGPLEDIQANDVSIPPVPEEAQPHQVASNAYLNTIRGWVGADPALQKATLNLAAQAHAAYVSAHDAQYQSSGLSPHKQSADWQEGFTAVNFGERCQVAGYSGSCNWEVITWVSQPEAAIDGWMDTLYHRVPLIHPNTSEFGYGMSLTSPACDVMDGAFGPTANTEPARWPLPGMKGVSTSWNGYESPQPPLPAGEAYPSGPIVTITFRQEDSKELIEATLADPSGTLVPVQVQSPQNDSWLSDTWCLYAFSPLQPQTTYSVSFKGKRNGQDVVESWEFTTQ